MGERACIKITPWSEDEFESFYFYTHWRGADLEALVAAGIEEARKHGRLSDEAYAARIILNVLQEGGEPHTGFGIMLEPPGDLNYPMVEVRWIHQAGQGSFPEVRVEKFTDSGDWSGWANAACWAEVALAKYADA